MIHKFFLIFLLLTSLLFAKDIELQKLFDKRELTGTVVISSLDNKTVFVSDDKRAKEQFTPASTFKIANTLIALEEKAVKDELEIIKWDGKDKGWKPWNQDHSIKSGFPVSCVWCFQELAKRIGINTYNKHLKQLDYGNMKTDGNLTRFWLDGDLKISALEQIEFLQKLYKNDLPYEQKNLDKTKDVMIVESNDDYIVRVKTGWAMKIGWYVGYIEFKDKTWFFAMNMNMPKLSQAKYRKEITMEALKIKGII
ncbi:OXA-48 family carbapenem-hydrolyzing class D beta-lactamase OXA-54 [Arcobacter sp. 15-2]|uniref:class D beta-lactamase n=1 Tax=Arcobacter sp. 15-2 TaxID=3374109 RepID=UPI00399CE1D5